MGNLKQRFGNLVAAHRKRVGWTQRQLAEAADLSDDMIARIEIGKTGVSFRSIEKLSSALQIDPAELFTTGLLGGSFDQTAAGNLSARMAGLKPDDILWLSGVIEAVLAPRR